jgi:alpha-amylase
MNVAAQDPASTPKPVSTREPIYLALGLHAHQPVGNFDHVFKDHLDDVYQPFLSRVSEGDLFPLTLHLSGPLLEWLERHASGYLDQIGRLVTDGKLELLLAGYYEPILPSLLREDRIDQIGWMREALRKRFGVEARGLWLTERVWEPDLAADLVDAGVDYVLLDDRHFAAAGFSKNDLHLPFRTEADGKSLAVFAIDENLRYFLPFQPPEDTATYLRELRASGRRLAVAADDIEKFGGWPGTKEWVYERGWMDDFIRTMKGMEESGEIRLATFGDLACVF